MHRYYGLPFLLGDRLVARVDLRSDRRNSALGVAAPTGEPSVSDAEIGEPLAAELDLMTRWLELDRVVTAPGGLGRAHGRTTGA